MTQALTRPGFVPEFTNPYLALFPHRYDYLWAPHPKAGQPTSWQTESSHTLSDRMIDAGNRIYGVRFGKTCNYAMLDIDRGSRYHPAHDPFAIHRIAAAMEKLGLCTHVAITSSYSGGIHLYFPFRSCERPGDQPIFTSELAIALEKVLQNSGLVVQDGHLECFPNARNYSTTGPVLTKGHRLPMQTGSYLLGDDWHPRLSNPEMFAQYWERAAIHNDIDQAAIARFVRQSGIKNKRLSFKAKKFLDDLNTDIDPGWSSYGQTNYILGRIAMRSYIFGHRIGAKTPLKGDALIQDIVRTAVALPGYVEYCRHQPEIWSRAEEWARSAENSKYYPYEYGKPKVETLSGQDTDSEPQAYQTYNKCVEQATRERLVWAIADLLNREALPFDITDRGRALVDLHNFSWETLYRHKDLWHPEAFYVEPDDDDLDQPEEKFSTGSGGEKFSKSTGNCAVGAIPVENLTSLLGVTERKALLERGKRAFWEGQNLEVGRNSISDNALSDRPPDKGGGDG